MKVSETKLVLYPSNLTAMAYRYFLSLRTGASGSRILAVIQLNPSMALGTKLDPTVGKVKKWAYDNMFSEVVFLNLFAYVSTDPAILNRLNYCDAVGLDNDSAIQSGVGCAHEIIIAWGGCAEEVSSHYAKRIGEVRQLLSGRKISIVGSLVKGRYPRHGRMWNKPHREMSSVNWERIVNSNMPNIK